MRDAHPLRDALTALAAGRPVLLQGDGGREDTANVVIPAALASTGWTAWMVRHTSGFLCAPLPAELADALGLPPMLPDGASGRIGFAVSVDARTGVGTGISAADRARTARVLADPMTRPGDLTRPGHVLPMRARPGGVLDRPDHAEAAADLCRLAGLPPVALISGLGTAENGDPMSPRSTADGLSRRAAVPLIDIADVVRHRLYHGDGRGSRVRRVAESSLPTRSSCMRAVGFRDEVTGAEHLALLAGPLPGRYPLVHVHTECVTGEVLGVQHCGCRASLDRAIERVSSDGGVVVYLRRADIPQLDRLGGHPATDQSEVGDEAAAAAILAELGFRTIRLLPGSAATPEGLAPGGVTAAGPVPPA